MIVLRAITLRGITEHFPARRFEWICAGIIFGVGLRLLDPAESFSQPSFSELARWAGEGIWGVIMLVVGAARLIVLAYNGAWRPSPEMRAAFAGAGGLLFLSFAWGIEASGTVSPGAIVYLILALGELSNVWTAAVDARTPYRERPHHGKLSG